MILTNVDTVNLEVAVVAITAIEGIIIMDIMVVVVAIDLDIGMRRLRNLKH